MANVLTNAVNKKAIEILPTTIEKERKKRNKIITIFSLSTIVIVGGILTYKFLK
jgi:hypothetical protein